MKRPDQNKIMEWSSQLGVERGGYKMGGGAIEVLPLQKKGGQVLAILIFFGGGHKLFWDSFNMGA